MTLTQTTQRIIEILKNEEIKINKTHSINLKNILNLYTHFPSVIDKIFNDELKIYLIHLLNNDSDGTLTKELQDVLAYGKVVPIPENNNDSNPFRARNRIAYTEWLENQFTGYDEYQRLLPKLSDANAQIKAEAYSKKSTSSKSKDNNDSLSQLLRETVAKVDRLDTKVNLLTDELKNRDETIVSLEAKNYELTAKNDELTVKNKKLEDELKKAKTEASILRTTSRDLRKDGIIHLHTL